MDEFAKDLGYENYSQLYGLIWNNLVEEETSLHVDKQKAELLAQLIEKTEIDIPEPLVEAICPTDTPKRQTSAGK